MIFLNYLLIVKILRVKVIWSIHNVCSPDSRETIFERIVITILLQFSNRVTAFNEYIKKVIKDKFSYEKIILMRQGIYENCYQKKIPKVKACRRLGVPEKKFVLLMFGSLQPYKGADLLIRAIANHKDDNLVVVLAGRTNLNPSYGRQLKKLAEKDDRIMIFDEYIPEREVPYFYGAADYTIYPYRHIANSGALFLSFTFGVPSIISDKGGVNEVTSIVPETSILIKEPTIRNIIAAIKEAKDRPYLKNKMLLMQQRLSWRHLTDSILEVFNFN
jgi:glycosyltransferase involved in cell wall biosynthesis